MPPAPLYIAIVVSAFSVKTVALPNLIHSIEIIAGMDEEVANVRKLPRHGSERKVAATKAEHQLVESTNSFTTALEYIVFPVGIMHIAGMWLFLGAALNVGRLRALNKKNFMSRFSP